MVFDKDNMNMQLHFLTIILIPMLKVLAIFVWRRKKNSLTDLTVLYWHLLRDIVCARFGEAVSSCQHPVRAQNRSETERSL